MYQGLGGGGKVGTQLWRGGGAVPCPEAKSDGTGLCCWSEEPGLALQPVGSPQAL